MRLVSPFPAESAAELHRWLNSPREPNFAIGQDSSLETVASMLAKKNAAGLTFAAQLATGELVGFIGFAPISPIAGWFAGMVIAPEHRGVGIGRLFLSAVVAELEAQGYRTMSAAVRHGNHGIRATFAHAGAIEDMRVLTFKAAQ